MNGECNVRAAKLRQEKNFQEVVQNFKISSFWLSEKLGEGQRERETDRQTDRQKRESNHGEKNYIL